MEKTIWFSAGTVLVEVEVCWLVGEPFDPFDVGQCFSTAGPRPGTGPRHQLHRAARGSPGICHFSFLSNFH